MSIQWPGAKSDFAFESFDLDRPGLRLLRLKPARARETPVECQLIQAFLDEDLIEYEAVSYTWGSAISLGTIILDGSRFFVPFNLSTLLSDIRLPDQDRILWVDAVCINQSDARERGHQVQRMGQIYQQALRVIIWLGPLGPLTEPSIGPLMDMLGLLQQQTRGVNWSLNDSRWRSHWEQVTKGSPDNLRSAFLELLKRPWFRRVWILQEVANAQRALVHCGPKAILAKIFALCPVLLNVELDSHCQAVLDVMPGPSRRESWWIQDRRLLTLLKKFSNTEATVEHDMIFALLGLCPEANARITVDYFKPIPQLLQETVAYFLSDDIFTFDIEYLQDIDCHSIRQLVHEVALLHIKVLETLLRSAPFHTVDAFVLRFHDEIASAPVSYKQKPLSIACMKGHEAIARLLLDQGAAAKQDDLNEALRGGHEAIVRLLLDQGAVAKQDDLNEAPNGGHGAFLVTLPGPEPATQQDYLNEASNGEYEAIIPLLLDPEAAVMEHTHTALAAACKQGHDVIARLLIDHGAPINEDMLNEACARKFEVIVRLLLNRGVSATQTALATACTAGNDIIVRLLLDRGALATGETLEDACWNGHEAIVRLLLDRGALATGEALKHACWRGDEAIVRLLLDRGAPTTGAALKSACNQRHEAIVRLHLLLDRRALATREALENACRRGDEAIVRLLLDWGAPTTGAALKSACNQGYEALVRLLLDRGTPATVEALENACRRGDEAIVRLLLDRGAPTTGAALKSACNQGYEALVRLLLDRGAPATVEALENACRRGDEALVRLLLDRGAPATVEALENACRRGDEAIVRLLLDQGVRPTVGALLVSSKSGHDGIVRILIGRDVIVDSSDIIGRTPLSWASGNGHEDVVGTLLDAVADCNKRDDFGQTPLTWALGTRNEGVIQLLRSRGATE